MKQEIKDRESWARCPICNVVWNTSSVSGGSWYRRRPVRDCDLPQKKLPEKLCPDHVEEIVVDGRKKGIKRTFSRGQLNRMRENGLYCPVCNGRDLKDSHGYEGPRPDIGEIAYKCGQCHTLIFVGIQWKSDDDDDEYGVIVYFAYREDLGTKELNEEWPDIVRIIDIPAAEIESVV